MADPRKVIREQNPEASVAATEEVVREIRATGRTVLPPTARRPRPAGDAASASGELVNLSEIDQSTQNLIGGAALAVQTIADLRRVGPDFRVDRQLRLVEDTGIIYRFNTADTTTPDDGAMVIAPDDQSRNNGRWFSVGVLDHGLLVGLGDDDHTQYQLRTEKGAVSGYAGLNASARLLFANFPIDFHREVNGNNEVSTSGAGFATVSGMTITPVAGTYQVFFTGNARTDTASRPTELGIAVAGGVLAYSTRCVPLTEYTPFACSAFVTVDGAQAITGVFRRDTGPPGPNAFVRERQMSLRRVS